ncbi:MAG: hypothetical protein ACD_28C00181G0006 [uncultured bacterium]|nr:MAG: hypothetical protein ACD_28C00181G0006 [uncultured bacterium]KKT75635.1 MAG: hypothetical protein UW70_C0032G0010 [Candidatus Peregrinibacteria bacterium GW2011_GWA2_44_7]
MNNIKESVQKLLGEELIVFELKGKGACNNAYYVETQSGKKFIIKEERPNGELKEQNSLAVEAHVIKQLSNLNFSAPLAKVYFISKEPNMFGYVYIEGDLLIDAWKKLTEEERIGICQNLGVFHAELEQRVTEAMAREMGVQINTYIGLHPEVEEEYSKILTFTDIPNGWKTLAQKTKTIFDKTLELGVFQFLHNDAHHENIIVKDGEITGIIDFGDSEYGEIAREFSRYIRDFPDHAEYIIKAYEKASGHKLSRERLISNSFLSGLMDNVEDYRKGGEDCIRAEKAVSKYEDIFT